MINKNKSNKKIINLNSHKNNTPTLQSCENQHQYQCMLAGNRLDGECELLIYNCYQRTAELFSLCFSLKGKITIQYFHEGEALLWKQNRVVSVITYPQAMTLLGDAARLVCLEPRMQKIWTETYTSIHAERIWEREYYNPEHSSLAWLLKEQNCISFLEQYFRAINNKDAVLLYDMMHESQRKDVERDMYAYYWEHALEKIKIQDFAVLNKKKSSDGKSWIYFLAICGETENGMVLSVNMCLHLVFVHGAVRLQKETVLDANNITSCCLEI